MIGPSFERYFWREVLAQERRDVCIVRQCVGISPNDYSGPVRYTKEDDTAHGIRECGESSRLGGQLLSIERPLKLKPTALPACYPQSSWIEVNKAVQVFA